MTIAHEVKLFAEQFRRYESIHRNKAQPNKGKIEANRQYAERAELLYFRLARLEVATRQLLEKIDHNAHPEEVRRIYDELNGS